MNIKENLGPIHTLTRGASNASHSVANTSTNVGNTVANKSTDIGNTIANKSTDVGNKISNTTTGLVGGIGSFFGNFSDTLLYGICVVLLLCCLSYILPTILKVMFI